MDQDLTAPSRYRFTEYSIDTRFADQVYDGTGDFMIRMPSTLRNVIRIALTSVEIPLVEYTFSARRGNLRITDADSIPAGNYTGTQLAAAISTATATPGLCTYNDITNRFTLAAGTYNLLSPDATIAARTKDWGLGYNLGFKKSQLNASGNLIGTAPFLAANSPSLGPATYYLLQLQCPDMMDNTVHRTSAGGSVPAFAKVVLRSGFYQVQFDDGANMVRKENTFAQPTSIASLRVRLVDAYGCTVDMGETDWSMTFEVMEVVSSNLYGELNRAYGTR
jgi:hypothetical protein